MTEAWTWAKKWGALVLGTILALVGAGWLWSRKSKRLGRVQDKLAVSEAQTTIAELQRARKDTVRLVGEKSEAIKYLDQKLDVNRRKIVEAHEFGKDLSDEEMADAFADLGL